MKILLELELLRRISDEFGYRKTVGCTLWQYLIRSLRTVNRASRSGEDRPRLVVTRTTGPRPRPRTLSPASALRLIAAVLLVYVAGALKRKTFVNRASTATSYARDLRI